MNDLERYLRITSASDPVWLGDGGVAYADNASGVSQIWKLKDGKTRQLTHFNSAAKPMCETEDGLLFYMDADGNENMQFYLLKEGREPVNLTSRPEVAHYSWTLDADGKTLYYSANAVSRSVFDVFRMDIKTGKSELVYKSSGNKLVATISPDGKKLLFTTILSNTLETLWMLDTTTGEAAQIPQPGAAGRWTNPFWDADGRGFHLLSDTQSDFMRLMHYDLATGALESVYEPGWDIESPSPSQDGSKVAIIVNADGYNRLEVFDLEQRRTMGTAQPPKGCLKFGQYAWNGDRLLFSLSTPTRPFAVWELDIGRDRLLRLTEPGMQGFESGAFCDADYLRFASFDGESIPYFLLKPKNAKYPMPAIIDIHGGPEYQADPMFVPLNQYFLSLGIAVVKPNVRGSGGYGLRYQKLDDVEKRMDSVGDIKALVERLGEEGVIAKNRLAVMGASYGGFMTLSCVTRFADTFAAAIDIVGISDMEDYMQRTSGYRRAHREAEYGSLERDRQLLHDISPIHKVLDIKAPLFVVHGANDPRVPVSNADKMVAALRENGLEVEYARYPDEGHGLSKLANKLDCYPRAAAFIAKHLGV